MLFPNNIHSSLVNRGTLESLESVPNWDSVQFPTFYCLKTQNGVSGACPGFRGHANP